jgi:hypothetical protein
MEINVTRQCYCLWAGDGKNWQYLPRQAHLLVSLLQVLADDLAGIFTQSAGWSLGTLVSDLGLEPGPELG